MQALKARTRVPDTHKPKRSLKKNKSIWSPSREARFKIFCKNRESLHFDRPSRGLQSMDVEPVVPMLANNRVNAPDDQALLDFHRTMFFLALMRVLINIHNGRE